MWVKQTAVGLEVWAPAKLNLFLEVLAKRSDGFHEIETLMCPVNLCDTLYFEETSTGRIELSVHEAFGRRSQQAHGDVLPEGTDNLVVRALRLLQERTGCGRGLRVRLTKRIPLAAGMAGGSSDAAAALLAANRLWQVGLDPQGLSCVAAELGSDIPFFFHRGAAICRGRGEKIESVALPTALHFVVVRPPSGLSTAKVFGACRPATTAQSIRPVVEAWSRGHIDLLGRRLHNRLQPIAAGLCDDIGQLEEKFSELEVLGHQMSGSGTSYFGLCRGARHARRIAATLRSQEVGEVHIVQACC